MKTQYLAFALILKCSILFAQKHEQHNYVPENGYVPDESTAIKIAVAVWSPIYGKHQIENSAPYNAELKNGVWVVTGSLPENLVGGVPIVEINKQTGEIIRVSHGL